MSALDGVNYAKSYSSTPSDRSNNIGDYGGAVKVLIDSKVGGIAVDTDTINIGKLPKGAKVLTVQSIGLGAGGSVNVAPMDVMSAETIVIATVGAGPSASIYAWVTYVCA